MAHIHILKMSHLLYYICLIQNKKATHETD